MCSPRLLEGGNIRKQLGAVECLALAWGSRQPTPVHLMVVEQAFPRLADGRVESAQGRQSGAREGVSNTVEYSMGSEAAPKRTFPSLDVAQSHKHHVQTQGSKERSAQQSSHE